MPGTCVWFAAHRLFREWRDCKKSKVLWVSADPGCGKSVLARHLVDSVLRRSPNPPTVCYFFFKDGISNQQNVVDALCCILHQLFTQRPDLLSRELVSRFMTRGRNLKSAGELWEILIRASEDADAGEIVCLFDAVDECENRGSQLIEALRGLYCHTPAAASGSRLKFLLTSRPFEDINLGLKPQDVPNSPIIRLSGETGPEMEEISREINIFIKARVEDIGRSRHFMQGEQDRLLERLLAVPNRTYLWVYLTLDLVEKTRHLDRPISDITDHLPETVESAYESILSKSSEPKEAKEILQIVAAAARPLTLKEMSVVLALHRNPGSKPDPAPEARFTQEIRDVCGLFVMVVDSRIYLIHQTAREFLVRSPEAAALQTTEGNTREWKHSIQLQESHSMLADACIQYLLLSDFERHPPGQDKSLSEYTERHVLLDYSSKYWATHTRELTTEAQAKMNGSVLKVCDANSNRFSTWFRVYWSSMLTAFPKGFTTLIAASYFGLEAAVKRLLKTVKRGDLDSRDEVHQRTALSWAAGGGYYAVTGLLARGARGICNYIIRLFRKDRRIDSLDKYGRSPLSYAVWCGNPAVVELLVHSGARVDLQDEIGGTPLSYAVCGGHPKIIELLSKEGVQPISEDSGRRHLLTAAERGDEGAVKMLLEKANVDPNVENEEGKTALHVAAQNGHPQVVSTLLRHSADIEAGAGSVGRPLDLAIERGHGRCVEAILECNPELNYSCNQYVSILDP